MDEKAMFEVGDAVVHPVRGAGVIVGIQERRQGDASIVYYRIELLRQPVVRLMLPVNVAETIGLRRAVSEGQVDRIWEVLGADPVVLSGDNAARYQFLKDQLRGGDVFQVAAVVRDMAWRQQSKRGLTTVGKRLYEEGLALLAAEVAAAQGVSATDTEAQIKGKLREITTNDMPL
jgi:CarD family transcriptional regulator